MDKNEVILKIKEYISLIDGLYPLQKVILYGSYARNQWNSDSDIDVAIVVETCDEDFLEELTNLYRIKNKVDARIEPIILEAGGDDSGFLENILQYGEVLYDKVA